MQGGHDGRGGDTQLEGDLEGGRIPGGEDEPGNLAQEAICHHPADPGLEHLPHHV
jgi:hypothetical protein